MGKSYKRFARCLFPLLVLWVTQGHSGIITDPGSPSLTTTDFQTVSEFSYHSPYTLYQFCALICPPAINQSNDPGQCSATIYSGLNVTWTGSCTESSLSWSISGATPPASGTGQMPTPYTFSVGTSLVTYVMDDGTGTPSTCAIQVNIFDTEDPAIQCPADVFLTCATQYFQPDTATVIASDNCDQDLLINFVGETYEGLGEVAGWCPTAIHRTYKATDDAGNSSTCIQDIQVIEDEYCDCPICQDNVPHFQVDLTADCDAVFVVEDIGRDGFCCDATWPDRCISFGVIIGEGSIGVFIEITEGAVPPGWWWQVDCGDSVAWNEIICIPPNEYHTITMCKAGANKNTYEIRAVCGMMAPDTIATRTDCAMEISVSGPVEESTVTWTSIYPGAEGEYNQYLSCDAGCFTTQFIPDQYSPPEIWYLVCGEVTGNPCPGENGSSIVCDTVVALVYPLVEVTILPYPPIFCYSDPHVITAYVTPPSIYDIQWWDDIDGTGNIVSTEFTFTPSEPGWYSVTVVDVGNALPCGYDTLNFEVVLQDCLDCPEQNHCDTSEIDRYQTVSEFIAAGGTTNYPCNVPDNYIMLLNEASDGLTCPETIIHTYHIWDECDNHDTCDVIITLDDTIAPVLTCPPELTGACSVSEIPPYTTLEEFIAAGGSASDYCALDPSSFQWVSDVTDGNTCPESIQRTYQIADLCGNIGTCSQTILIDDIIPPVILCPENYEVECLEDIPACDPAMATATDNCDPAPAISCSSGPLTGGPCGGTVTITYTAEDDCGNTASCDQVITVNDQTPPVADPLPDIGPFACFEEIPAADIDDVTGEADNCLGPVTVTFVGDTPDPGCDGTVTRTYNVTDECGNFISITQAIKILDTIAPTADPLPALGPYDCYGNIPPPNTEDVTGESDNCTGPVSVTFVSDTPDPGCEGLVIRTYQLTDECGNSSLIDQEISIEYADFTMPADDGTTVPCYSDVTEPVPPIVNDNCGVLITPSGPVIGGTYEGCEGTVTYTWTYNDCAGNIHDWVYTYTIEYEPFEPIPPTTEIVDCYADIVLPVPPVVLDNCGEELIPTGPVESGPVDCEGEVTYTWTFTDCEGNSQDYVHTVTIEYQDFTMPADTGSIVLCFGDVNEPVPPEVYDHCNMLISPTGPVIGGTYAGCEGTVTYMWTYTDCAGNSHDWAYTYTIEYQDFTMPADTGSIVWCFGDATEPLPPVVYDNCDMLISPTGPVIGGTYAGCEGTVTYTWNFTDCAGNSHDWVYTYTIEYEDFTMPADDGTTVSCYSEVTEPVPPAVDDNCGMSISPSGPLLGGDYAGCEGTVTYTWTYTDCAGNSHDWVYTYTIEYEDFTMPADDGTIVSCYNDATEPVPPVVHDHCNMLISPSGPVLGGDYAGCEGTVTYTWTYSDCEGNSHDWVYTYTIEYEPFEPIPPTTDVFNCYMDIVLPDPPTVLDNCGVELIPVGPVESLPLDCEGEVTYTWTYTDCEGNSQDYVHTVTIEYQDFMLPADEGVNIACYNEAIEPVPPVVIDSCGLPINPVGPVIGGTYVGCEGTVTYTWNYADCAGNSHYWVFAYTIEYEDFIMPADDGTTVSCYADAAEPVPPVVYDNCDTLIIPIGPVIGGTYAGCEGTVTYTWTYTDCEGNSHDWVYTYTIEYEDFTMPADEGSTVACYGEATEPVPPVVYDSCGILLIPSGPVIGGTYAGCEETVTYTWTYTDCEGNSHDWVYTYTIEYEDFTMPADDGTTVSCYMDVTEPVPPVVYDNCDTLITPSGPVIGGTYAGCEGTVTFTWTYTDCEGNSHDWIYTYTIEYEDFTMPSDDGTTVSCYSDINEPVPPAVNDNCGVPISPSGPVIGGTYLGCEGTVTYSWNYTDCEGNSHDWLYTYTIEYEDFTMPADDGTTVSCYSDASEPVPPVVYDNCNILISPTGPVIGGTYAGCEGTVTYTWNYSDCEGNNHDWTYTYTIEYETFVPITPTTDIVDCYLDIVLPLPPTVLDNCGVELVPSGPVESLPLDCEGEVTYTWTYADCEGNSQDYVHTVTIEYQDFLTPADEGMSVACYGEAIEPVPPVVYDSCGMLINPVGPVIGGTYAECEGTVTYTWNYADCEGNSHYWVFTYTIEYEDFIMPADSGIAVACYGEVTEPVPPVVYDNCDSLITPVGPVIGGNYIECEGTVTYSWTYTDCEGNSHDWTFTYLIDDEIPPEMTCPGPLTAVCSGTEAPAYTTFNEFVAAGGSASDNCGLDESTFTLVSETNDGATCPETITRTYQIADDCGNTATCQQFIIVDDDIAPTITCPPDTIVIAWDDIPLPLTSLTQFLEAGGSVADNCGVADFEFVGEEEIIIGQCPRMIERTYLVGDSCGNTATCVHTIMQDDDTPPEVSCPPDTNVVCVGDIPAPWTSLAEFIAAGGTVSDDDVTKEFNYLGQMVTGQCPRIITRTYEIVDSCDNATTCQHIITQLDNVEPAVVCPNTLVFSCFDLIEDPYQTIAEFLAAGGQASDNCGLESFLWISDSSDYNNCPETIYRKYQVVDSCGNAAWCHQVILVNDEIPPEISCPASLTAVCSGAEQTAYTNFTEFVAAGGSASDNCGLDESSFILLSDASDGASCPETITRTYQIADDCGNTATCQQLIIVADDIAPTIACPPDTIVIAWDDIPLPLTTLTQFLEAGGSVADNCEVAGFEYLGEEEIIIGLCPRMITRTYMVEDLCGNTATCEHTIMQDDDTPPEVSCPPDTTVVCVGDIPAPWTTLAEFIEAGGMVTDDDITKEFNYLGQVVTGQCPRIITRTYEVVDSCDNGTTCQHLITQFDDIKPVITCPDSLSFDCFEMMPTPFQTLSEFLAAGGQASDNCGLASFSWVSDSSDYQYCPATVYRKYQVIDSCDNVEWCQQIIMINDQVPPEIACQPAITVTCHDDVPAPDITQVTATDNCGTAAVSWVEDIAVDSTCVNQLQIVRYYMATDMCGNTAVCTQLITVFDDVMPEITCPVPITVICANDVPDPDVAQVSASDNCGTATVSWIEDMVDDTTIANQIIITRIYMATDDCGNTATCSTTITINDQYPPTIICPPDTTVYISGQVCDTYINIDIPQVFDDCGIESLVNDYTYTEDASAIYPIGITVVTWTVTDISGNTATCSMTVTVISLLEAIDDFASTDMNTPVDINVLLNDIYCIDILDTNVLNILEPTIFGTLAFTDTFGIVTYTPYFNYHGYDQFIYQICDTLGYCDTALVIIYVREVINHPPIAVDDYAKTDFYIPVTIKILDNDWDPDGDSIFLVSILSLPGDGQLEVNDDQTVTYTPDPGFMGVDVFSYLIRDDGYPILFDSANVYVEVPETPYEEIPFKIYNTLTPNGDGDNDYWKILGIEYFPDNDIVLTDRWGEIIHTYDGYNNSTVRWEGKDEAGRMLRNGVYFYILELHNMNKLYKGWVMLHR